MEWNAGQLPEVVCRNDERIVSETFCHWHLGNVLKLFLLRVEFLQTQFLKTDHCGHPNLGTPHKDAGVLSFFESVTRLGKSLETSRPGTTPPPCALTLGFIA